MIKKIGIATICCSLAVAWATDVKKIAERLSNEINQKINVVEVVPYSKNMDLVIMESNGERSIFFLTKDGQSLFASNSLVYEENQGNYKKYTERLTKKEYYNSQRKTNMIADFALNNPEASAYLKSSKKTSRTKYIILDPNCPFCVDEVSKIDSILADYNVVIFVVNFLGKTSELKANYFYNTLPSVKNSRDKTIALLKEVFAKRSNLNGKNIKANKNVPLVTDAMVSFGITQVPFSVVR